MEWTEMMARRDRVVELLRPHLGKQMARERANDIVQAFVCSEEDPCSLARRMLVRDLEPRAADIVGYQLGRAWQGRLPQRPAPAELEEGPQGVAHSQHEPGVERRVARPRAHAGPANLTRRRRETIIIGLWN